MDRKKSFYDPCMVYRMKIIDKSVSDHVILALPGFFPDRQPVTVHLVCKEF